MGDEEQHHLTTLNVFMWTLVEAHELRVFANAGTGFVVSVGARALLEQKLFIASEAPLYTIAAGPLTIA